MFNGLIEWFKEREEGINELSDGLKKVIRPVKKIKQPDVDYAVLKDTYAGKSLGILGNLSKEIVVHDRKSSITKVFPYSSMVLWYLEHDDKFLIDMSSNIHDLFSHDRVVLLQRFPYPRRGL